jgi:hypothetical protein
MNQVVKCNWKPEMLMSAAVLTKSLSEHWLQGNDIICNDSETNLPCKQAAKFDTACSYSEPSQHRMVSSAAAVNQIIQRSYIEKMIMSATIVKLSHQYKPPARN